jgi:hypothetical protein
MEFQSLLKTLEQCKELGMSNAGLNVILRACYTFLEWFLCYNGLDEQHLFKMSWL